MSFLPPLYIIFFLFVPSCFSMPFHRPNANKFENVSHTLKVTHYDCSEISENEMYSLNQIGTCDISLENTIVAQSKIQVYQRSFRTVLTATMCRVKALPIRFNCGMYSHSSIVHNQNMITYDKIVTPEACALAATTKIIKVSEFGKIFSVSIEFDVLKQSNFNTGQT